MNLATDYILLDFETTGLNALENEIIEIGAVRMQGLTPIAQFERLVRPQTQVPQMITELTGITPEMLEDAPELESVAAEFFEFCSDGDTGLLPFVAHNSRMEQSFLDAHLLPLADIAFNGFNVHNSIDVLALIAPERPSHSMESFRDWLKIDNTDAHRALKDCIDLAKVLQLAHEFMSSERPYLPGLVNDLIGTFDEEWWWGWYFNHTHESKCDHTEVTKSYPKGESTRSSHWEHIINQREPLGELRDLKKEDTEKEIDWSLTPSASTIIGHLDHALENGLLTQRESQKQMALLLRKAFEKGERIAIEAPTGTGKSVAYLLPGALTARATQAPLVVSTHSKTLQDQLLEKDLPLVRKITQNNDLSATTVKGQDNYICLRKLFDARFFMTGPDADADDRWSYAYIMSLVATTTSTGKLVELDRISHYLASEKPPLRALTYQVRSHFTTTRGPGCPFYKVCHFFDSARLAHQSDVIIANHALTFRWPSHLPKIRNIVFDEAHHIENQITDAHTHQIDEDHLAEMLDRLDRGHNRTPERTSKKSKTQKKSKKQGDSVILSSLISQLTLPSPHDKHDPEEFFTDSTDKIRTRLERIRALIPELLPAHRGDSNYEIPIELSRLQGGAATSIHEALEQLTRSVGQLTAYLAAASEALVGAKRSDTSIDLLMTHTDRFQSLEKSLQAISTRDDANLLRLLHWNPAEHVWRAEAAPIDVKGLGTSLLTDKRSIALTSATLGTGTQSASGSFFSDRVGLELNEPLIALASPYDLAHQATVYIPKEVAVPGTPSHLDSLIDFTASTARLLQGRTLLLITSNARLRKAAEELRERLSDSGISVFDSISDKRAVDHFRATEKALLIGSERYGEGIDLPGRQLSCVIIEKINEAMTRGPLAEARKSQTKFSLFDYDFPLRMIWLKQRVGRLIRSTLDRGVVIVFDPRYNQWGASSRTIVHRALAPMPIRTGTPEEILTQMENMNL